MSKSSIAWNKFGTLKNALGLEKYMQREYEHSGYYHYTTLQSIDNILGSKTFWLSSVQGFNDKKEIEFFGENANKYFSLCFSTGVNENLALWYLYSGVEGKGGRIKLTRTRIQKLIENSRYCLAIKKKDSDELIELFELTEKDYEYKFKDVIYFKDGEKHVNLKYNTMTNYNISKDEFEKYKDENLGFYKYLIWYYEKETRLLVELKGKAEEHVKKHSLTGNEHYIVKMSFGDLNDVIKSLKIDLGPEFDDIEKIKEYKNIYNFLMNTSNVSKSDYSGQIKMNLKNKDCDNCKKKDQENDK